MSSEKKVGGTKFNTRLFKFNQDMKEAFKNAAVKHPKDDVLNDSTKWNWSYGDLELHLIQEFCEYFELSQEQYKNLLHTINQARLYSHGKTQRNAKELVDLANLSFFLSFLLHSELTFGE